MGRQLLYGINRWADLFIIYRWSGARIEILNREAAWHGCRLRSCSKTRSE
jgi:hypothetical protein